MRYAHRVADLCEIVIEKGETSYGAYVPDLPGCFAVGESLEELKELITEAILFHIDCIDDKFILDNKKKSQEEAATLENDVSSVKVEIVV
jgi:predicted RNase H-like HicB family nuclease